MSGKIERIPEEQLRSQLNAVRAHIRRTRKHGSDTRDAEVELCYLEREGEHRDSANVLDRNYRAKVDAIRKADAKNAREEEEALRSYWETSSAQGLNG